MKRSRSSFIPDFACSLLGVCLAAGSLAAQTPVPDSKEGLRDIAPPVSPTWLESMNRTDWMLLLGGAALLAFAVYLAWYFFLRPKPVPPALPADPREVARAALTALRRCAAELSARDFGAEASGILRQFIRARFGISTLRRTSEEFLAAIARDQVFSARESELLGRFLTQCDALKFANLATSHPEALRLADDALAFVENASPRAATPPPLHQP